MLLACLLACLLDKPRPYLLRFRMNALCYDGDMREMKRKVMGFGRTMGKGQDHPRQCCNERRLSTV